MNSGPRGVQIPVEPRPLSSSLRWIFPSITDLIFILLLVAATYGILAPRLLGDADIGWHIRNGQNILATLTIPRTDPFSATMNGHLWCAWEWLYDSLVGLIYNRTGLQGVVFFSALSIAATLASVFRLALRRGGSPAMTLLLWLVATVASSIHFLARPHVISWFITVVWFWIQDSNYRQVFEGIPGRRVFWLPLLMLFWANLHGGFVLGFFLLAIFLAADLLKLVRCHDPEQRRVAKEDARGLAAVFVASVLASLINPYGYKLHAHIYQYLSNRFLMQHIEEFRRADLHGLPAQFFLLLLGMTVLGILSARVRLRWVEWLLVGFSAWFGLFAARNIPISSMLLTMVVAPLFARKSEGSAHSDGLLPRLRAFTSRMSNRELSLRAHLWPIVLVLVSAWICLDHGELFGKRVMDAHFSEHKFPVEAVKMLVERGNHEPIYSLDSWGGYLIYRLYPNVKVFIDDRHDFYGEAYLRDYLKVLQLEPGWENTLAQQHVNLVLMPMNSKLAGALRHQAEWKTTYEDQTAAVFERVRKI